MKRFVIPFLIAGSLVAHEGVKWETSLPEAQKRAKAEHKLIFMDVWTEWCGWCIKLQKDTFPSAEGQAALAKVVPLSLKTQFKDRRPTADNAYEGIYKVDGFPALFLLDADGKEVARVPGYLPPTEFAAWINRGVAAKK
jgi:thioredoxin-related protein